jgi:hypothetical protein
MVDEFPSARETLPSSIERGEIKCQTAARRSQRSANEAALESELHRAQRRNLM